MSKGRGMLWGLAGLGLCSFLGVSLGSGPLDWRDAWSAFQSGGDSPALRILLHVRFPRVAGALLSGAGFAVSGAILQGVLENPLASPNVIGINAGAGLFVLLASAIFPAYPGLLVPAAFAGALLAASIVLAISAYSTFSPLSVVLCGFVISSMFSAGMNLILLVNPDAYVGSGNFLAGGLSGLTLGALSAPLVYLGVGLIAAVVLSPSLNILALGTDSASSLGMRVPVRRLLLLLVAAMLAGASVSFAGMIGFVGLVAPHAARLLVGQDNCLVIPFSALLGASLVVLCDLLTRVLFAPFELPVGILLAFLGGPVFLLLIMKNRRESQ